MTYGIPLQSRPLLRQMAAATHGSRPSDTWRLPSLWCMHLYHYEGTLIADGHLMEIRPGHASVFPPGTALEYRYQGPSRHLYAHFSLPAARRPAARIPAMQPLGAAFASLNRAFEEALGWFPVNPLRIEIRLWDILWRLALDENKARPAPRPLHPAVAAALRSIEMRLEEPLYVKSLAREAGFSHNHFTRLFHAAVGQGVASWIHDRRVERAMHLLHHSTRSIKEIAAEVGIPDLHAFNKAMRGAYGRPPRVLRAGAALVRSASSQSTALIRSASLARRAAGRSRMPR